MTELERKLKEAPKGQAELEALMTELLNSKVFILTDKNPNTAAGFDTSATPLIMVSSSGTSVLAVFTDPERSIAWNKQYPKYGISMHVDFRWLVKGVASGTGIVINPGSPDGMEISPSGADQLKRQAA